MQAHSKMDYSTLDEKIFVLSIKEYLIFKIKHKLNLFDKKIDEISFNEILIENKINNTNIGVLYPKHLRGRLFISFTAVNTSFSLTLSKVMFLGKYCLSNPLLFSLSPLSQL